MTGWVDKGIRGSLEGDYAAFRPRLKMADGPRAIL